MGDDGSNTTWYCSLCGTLNMAWYDVCPACEEGFRSAVTTQYQIEEVDELSRGYNHLVGAIDDVHGLGSESAIATNEAGRTSCNASDSVESDSLEKLILSDGISPPTNAFESDKYRSDEVDASQPYEGSRRQEPRSASKKSALVLGDQHMDKRGTSQPLRSSREQKPHVLTQILVEPPPRRPQKASRPEGRPTQGDWVTIGEMDPNRPDVDSAACQEAPTSDSDSTDEEDDHSKDAMEVTNTKLSREHTQRGVQSVQLSTAPKTKSEQQRQALARLGKANIDCEELVRLAAEEMGITLDPDMLKAELSATALAVSKVIGPPTPVGTGSYIQPDTNGTLSDHLEIRELTAEDAESRSQIDADGTSLDYPTIQDLLAKDDELLSAYAESVFSNDSAESSATGISAMGAYTEDEVMTATKELVDIFIKDPAMSQLYQRAFEDPRIGPDRLKRNVHRLLKIYSQDLHREAQGELERLASQLVAVKSRYVTQCVMEKFFVKPPSVRRSRPEIDDDSEEEDIKEDDLPAIDEDRFEDLLVFHQFLVESVAFRLFQERLKSFVQPKRLNPPHDQVLALDHVEAAEATGVPCASSLSPGLSSEKEPKGAGSPSLSEKTSGELVAFESEPRDDITDIMSSTYSRLSHSTRSISSALLVRLGLLEPPLQPGSIRLRWRCGCGDPLFGDVQEYRAGGISKLMEQMEGLIGSKVTASSYEEGTANERYIPAPIIWAKELVKNFTAFMKPEDSNNRSSRHTDSKVTAQNGSVAIDMPPVPDLLLLSCMHQEEGSQALYQSRIGTIETDRELFLLIRKQLTCTRNVRWKLTQLRKVTGIHITKFHLRLSDVEPRLHKPCCRPDACQCVPMISNADYDCIPAGPLEFGPPILPQHMLHYLKHPERISEKEMSVLNQIPKRNCGELKADGKVPADGWGLYYEEDWDIGMIIAVIAATSIFASLVFGICWTTMKGDIQGAWGAVPVVYRGHTRNVGDMSCSLFSRTRPRMDRGDILLLQHPHRDGVVKKVYSFDVHQFHANDQQVQIDPHFSPNDGVRGIKSVNFK